MTAATAGFIYFLIVFAAGFALGAVRTLWLTPAVGATAATLIELPLILAFSWAACLMILKRMNVKARVFDRIVMGAVAFALLIAADLALGLGLMDRDLAAQFEAMMAPPALIGLAGQIVFAAFPLLGLLMKR